MLQQALLFTLIPLAAAVISGVVASFWSPSPVARSYIQHFAPGCALFGESTLETVADKEGFFEVRFDLSEPLEGRTAWYPVDLELLWPGARMRPARPERCW